MEFLFDPVYVGGENGGGGETGDDIGGGGSGGGLAIVFIFGEAIFHVNCGLLEVEWERCVEFFTNWTSVFGANSLWCEGRHLCTRSNKNRVRIMIRIPQ